MEIDRFPHHPGRPAGFRRPLPARRRAARGRPGPGAGHPRRRISHLRPGGALKMLWELLPSIETEDLPMTILPFIVENHGKSPFIVDIWWIYG